MKRFNVRVRDFEVNISLPHRSVIQAVLFCDDSQDGVPENLEFQLGGQDREDNNLVGWTSPKVEAGDQIVITIYDDQLSDPPDSRTALPTAAMIREMKEATARRYAADLGWKLIEFPLPNSE